MAPLGGSVTFIYCDDMDASTRFYEGALGLAPRHTKAGVRFYALCAGNSLGLVPSGESAVADAPCSRNEAGRDTAMLCLLTRSVDELFARAVRGGAAVVRAPSTMERYGIRSGVVRDPGGYLVEIQRFEDAAVHRRFVAARRGFLAGALAMLACGLALGAAL